MILKSSASFFIGFDIVFSKNVSAFWYMVVTVACLTMASLSGNGCKKETIKYFAIEFNTDFQLTCNAEFI